jgi:hypothetical protein
MSAPGLVAKIGLLCAITAAHIVLSDPGALSRVAAAGLAATFVLAALLPKSRTMLAAAAAFLSAAMLVEHVVAPFLAGSENLMRIVADRIVWPSVLQGVVVGELLRSIERDREAKALPRSPWTFLFSCIASGTGLLLLLESALAAAGPVAAGSALGVVLHAFAADTAIHLVLLVLWFGLSLRAGELYARFAQDPAGASREGLFAQRRQIESLSRLLPMLGFLGTVIGLAGAIGAMSATMAGDAAFGRASLDALFRNLALKFETSLLGLAAAIFTGLVMSAIDGLQERAGARDA